MVGKKLVFVISLILVLALGLSACTPAETIEPGAATASPEIGATVETGGEVTLAPTGQVGATEQPGAATSTPAVEETEELETATATPEAEATGELGAETPTPGAEATEDPGADLESAWTFSELLNSTVLGSACEPVGQLQGLVLDLLTGKIHYVVMYSEVSATGVPTGRYLIPWEATVASRQVAGAEGAVEGTPEAGGATGTPEAGTPAAGTPAAGAVTGTPETGAGVGEVACETEQSQVVLTVGTDLLANAPSFTITPNLAAEGWDEEVVAFWSDQLGALPVTGEADGAQLTMVETARDLSVVGAADEQIAVVEELIIDQQTASVSHVVVSTGGTGGEEQRLVPVPWEALGWANGARLALAGGADESILSAAPGFASLDELLDQTGTPGWDAEIQDFWSQYIQQ